MTWFTKIFAVLIILFSLQACNSESNSPTGDILDENSESGGLTPTPPAESSSGGEIEEPIVISPPNIIASRNDPLMRYQWYLANSGRYEIMDLPAVTLPGEDITSLAAGSSIESGSGEDYALGYTGEGLVVAVIDSGLEILHEDLAANVQPQGSYNFGYPLNGMTQFDPTLPEGEDHGTSVAGLIAARGGNGIGIWGVAPRASLKGFNFLEYPESLEQELQALGQASEGSNIPNQNIDIFNMSYGSNPDIVELSDYDAAVMQQIEYGAKHYRGGKGAIYVKAGGNEFGQVNDNPSEWCDAAAQQGITCYNVNMEPLNTTPALILAGAFNAMGERASYSSTGSALWISAPGGEYGYEQPALLTTDMSGCDQGYAIKDQALPLFDQGELLQGADKLNANCHYTATFNGTSSSTPIISGVAALLLQANPNLTARELKHILATSARQIQPELQEINFALTNGSVMLEQGWVSNAAGIAFSNAFGFGAVDVQAALEQAIRWRRTNTVLAEQKTVQTPQQSYSMNNEIPNASALGLTKTQQLDESLTVESVLLELSIKKLSSTREIDASDYLIHLISPSGTVSVVQTPFNAFRSGYDMDNMRLISHAFYGEDLNGEWTLKIWDVNDHLRANGRYDNRINGVGEGKLADWKLTFYGREQ